MFVSKWMWRHLLSAKWLEICRLVIILNACESNKCRGSLGVVRVIALSHRSCTAVNWQQLSWSTRDRLGIVHGTLLSSTEKQNLSCLSLVKWQQSVERRPVEGRVEGRSRGRRRRQAVGEGRTWTNGWEKDMDQWMGEEHGPMDGRRTWNNGWEKDMDQWMGEGHGPMDGRRTWNNGWEKDMDQWMGEGHGPMDGRRTWTNGWEQASGEWGD